MKNSIKSRINLKKKKLILFLFC